MIGQQNVYPKELLAERYLLQEEIGKGRMSTVIWREIRLPEMLLLR